LNQNHFESLLRTLLLIKAYRVEIYTTPSNAKTASVWNLEFKVIQIKIFQLKLIRFVSGVARKFE
jgi:hypothetical protein